MLGWFAPSLRSWAAWEEAAEKNAIATMQRAAERNISAPVGPTESAIGGHWQ